jgi:hypothetical protein
MPGMRNAARLQIVTVVLLTSMATMFLLAPARLRNWGAGWDYLAAAAFLILYTLLGQRHSSTLSSALAGIAMLCAVAGSAFMVHGFWFR